MVFNNLSTDYQNVLLQNFDLQGKLYLIFIILSFSLIYKFYWKPFREEETPFFSIGILRTVLSKSSTIFLWLSPLMIFYITPQNTVWNLLDMILGIYVPVVLLSLVITIGEAMQFGVYYVLNEAGMKTDDERVKLFLSKLNKRGRFK